MSPETILQVRPSRSEVPWDLIHRPKLREYLEACLHPFRQFQADQLGESFIQELRGQQP